MRMALDGGEFEQAKRHWIRVIQRELFPREVHNLTNRLPVPRNSKLLSLTPFLDEHGIVRVGGRLRHSILPDRKKHPIVLGSHMLVALIIAHAHLKALHSGTQLTLRVIRDEYWILRARQTVRSVIHRCVACARERAAQSHELMGDLPEMRVRKGTRAFLHCGVDYAGPILTRPLAGRGYKARKSYIALFICLTVRAVHLELVSDYTTAAFIAAFRRFCARRGVPVCLYSDNAKNFRGADRELHQQWKLTTRDPTFLNKLASESVRWKFIPPSAPHFGGLWEAGVRSVKYHLKRCVGAHTLSFEEMTTFLCQVEACLNSRPLAPFSDDPTDLSALTPAHFLVGSALTSVPSQTPFDGAERLLSRWQLVQALQSGFWHKWSHDYVQTLHQRPKWREIQGLAKVGRLVLVRNALAPPCQWELARIIACHPGSDGVTRVVTIKTAHTTLKRPIVKLCFLPIDIDDFTDHKEACPR